jgi:hypothetical protein
LFCFGLVWFGLVWFGLVWFGLVWFGLVFLFFVTGTKLRFRSRPPWTKSVKFVITVVKFFHILVDNLRQAVRTQLVDGLLTDLLQDARFLHVYYRFQTVSLYTHHVVILYFRRGATISSAQ